MRHTALFVLLLAIGYSTGVDVKSIAEEASFTKDSVALAPASVDDSVEQPRHKRGYFGSGAFGGGYRGGYGGGYRGGYGGEYRGGYGGEYRGGYRGGYDGGYGHGHGEDYEDGHGEDYGDGYGGGYTPYPVIRRTNVIKTIGGGNSGDDHGNSTTVEVASNQEVTTAFVIPVTEDSAALAPVSVDDAAEDSVTVAPVSVDEATEDSAALAPVSVDDAAEDSVSLAPVSVDEAAEDSVTVAPVSVDDAAEDSVTVAPVSVDDAAEYSSNKRGLFLGALTKAADVSAMGALGHGDGHGEENGDGHGGGYVSYPVSRKTYVIKTIGGGNSGDDHGNSTTVEVISEHEVTTAFVTPITEDFAALASAAVDDVVEKTRDKRGHFGSSDFGGEYRGGYDGGHRGGYRGGYGGGYGHGHGEDYEDGHGEHYGGGHGGGYAPYPGIRKTNVIKTVGGGYSGASGQEEVTTDFVGPVTKDSVTLAPEQPSTMRVSVLETLRRAVAGGMGVSASGFVDIDNRTRVPVTLHEVKLFL